MDEASLTYNYPDRGDFKNCAKCHRMLLLTTENFPRNRSSRDGFGHWCKRCHREYVESRKNKNTNIIQQKNQRFFDDVLPSLLSSAISPNSKIERSDHPEVNNIMDDILEEFEGVI